MRRGVGPPSPGAGTRRGPGPTASPGGGRSPSRAPPRPEPRPTSRVELSPTLVLLGEFGRAHGLKGEVRVKSYTADPLAIAGYGPLTAANGSRVTLTSVRQAAGDQPDVLVARVEGVTSREAAEALNRVGLLVERSRIAADTEEDEFLLADLVGLKALDEAGDLIGNVIAVPNYGAGDLLEIARPGSRQSVLVPFTKVFVPRVAPAEGHVVVAAPDLFSTASGIPDDPVEGSADGSS